MSFCDDNFHTQIPDLNEGVLPDLNKPFISDYDQSYSQPSYVEQSNPENFLGSQHSYVEESNPIVSYETNQDFESREDLVDWATKRGLVYGFVIVIQRSTSRGVGELARCVRVELGCTNGGEHKSTATIRRSSSKKNKCPFLLVGVYSGKRCAWKLQVKNETHNHDPVAHLERHACARKLSVEEYNMVAKLHEQNLEPRKIFSAIRQHNPDSVCVQKDIYNVIAKIRRVKKVSETSMQVLEDIDYDKELEAMKQYILSQPNIVKKSLISKIRAVIFSVTRGRSTTKQQEQRKADAARNNSFTGSQQSIPEPARHSSYTTS